MFQTTNWHLQPADGILMPSLRKYSSLADIAKAKWTEKYSIMHNEISKYIFSKTKDSIIVNGGRVVQNFERADKIIIWIVGFSIGTFVLILKNNNLEYVSASILSKQIAIISLITTISGLLYRISSFYTQILFSEIINQLSSYSDTLANMPNVNKYREINLTDSSEDILRFIEEDFGIKIHKQTRLSTITELVERNMYAQDYKNLVEQNSVEKQLEIVYEQIANHLGKPISSLKRQFENSNKKTIRRGKLYRIMFYSSSILFSLTILIFIGGIGLLLVKLL